MKSRQRPMTEVIGRCRPENAPLLPISPHLYYHFPHIAIGKMIWIHNPYQRKKSGSWTDNLRYRELRCRVCRNDEFRA